MKKYEDLMDEINLFNELNNAACDRLNREMDVVEDIQRSYNHDYEEKVASVRNLASATNAKYNTKINSRKVYALNIVNSLKRLLTEIKDPHFRRMEKKYIVQARNNRRDVLGLSEEELKHGAEAELNRLKKYIGKLNQAFIPAGASNAIGAVVHSYRKNKYKQIIESRNLILDYVEPLIDESEINALIEEVEAVCERHLSEEYDILQQQLYGISGIRNEKVSMVLNSYNSGIDMLNVQSSIFDADSGDIAFGAYIYKSPIIPFYAQSILTEKKNVVMGEEEIYMPIAIDSIQNNYVYVYSGENQINRHFISSSLDMLLINPDNEVIYVDVKGLGSEYAVINKLTSTGHVNVWSTNVQVTKGLDELELWISSIYSEILTDRYDSLIEYNRACARKKPEKYIFINDLKSNLEQRDFEKLERIIKNGRKAGVYVIASTNIEDIDDRQFSEIYNAIQASMKTIIVKNMIIELKRNSYIVLKSSIERSKIDALASLLLEKKVNKEIISLGPHLPENGNWHKMCAEKEIVVPFGVDTNGKEVILKISSEKPYIMIIGDPRHGKSKLMHTIIMMITSCYSEDEVTIGVMDLKDGAEFNVYAKAGIKSIECVVNDEDPEAMLSFLKYYVAQMHTRQELFERMEEATGIIVQKYEDYRATNIDMNGAFQQMPRLVLLIDEFQTLFDGVSSSAYMSELVRKGATYGIHVILSSQRAVSSNPRNGFTSDLKDYFTSRFVFKCPQPVAKSVLSERCADTQRENSGIQKAALLDKGHVIYNSYMGQNESDNLEVQCFYPSPELISSFISVLEQLKGGGEKILCKKNAKSRKNCSKADGRVHLGDSIRVHYDISTGSNDYIKDDMTVSFSMESELKNMIISGMDLRVVDSIIGSLGHYAATNRKQVILNVLGNYKRLKNIYGNEYFEVHYYSEIGSQINTCESLSQGLANVYVVNLFLEPDQYEEYLQSHGGIRKVPGAEMLKSVLKQNTNSFTIIYSKSFRNLRSSLQYVMNDCPIRITTVGDCENVKLSMSENIHMISGDFDIPRNDSIKAYYYNKQSDKYGKMIMYSA